MTKKTIDCAKWEFVQLGETRRISDSRLGPKPEMGADELCSLRLGAWRCAQ